MKRFNFRTSILAITTLIIATVSTGISANDIFSSTAGKLRLAIDDKGKITALTDTASSTNYISKRGDSWLMRIQLWDGKVNPARNPVLDPISATLVKRKGKSAVIELKYKGGEKVRIGILNKKSYFKMRLLKATPLGNISMVSWGPYFTAMQGPVGRYIGISRSDDFSIGLLSLEMNTDGEGWDHNMAAGYDRGGSKLIQLSYDRTKPRALPRSCKYIIGGPIKGVSVVASTVALFGVPRGEKNELTEIERIELAEKLPHPVFKGKWAKLSKEVQSPCLWTTVNIKTIDNVVSLAKDFAAGSVCQFHGFFKNWGHFDISEKDYPSGMDGVKRVSAKCAKAGIHNTVYTLTTFLRPHPEIEPYIAPVPDDRLAFLTLDTNLSLAEPISADSASMKLKLSKGLTPSLKDILKRFRKVVRVDNEMIEFKSWKEAGNGLLLCENLDRGGWLTTKAPHKTGAKARYMYISGYNNFYPGNQKMNLEVADNIGKVTAQGSLGKIILDGYESILDSGADFYGRNTFIKHLYDMTRRNEVLFSGSNFGNYNWHIMSFMSWGEFDNDKGFRGTMIENRLRHQVTLKASLMPNKLGQYYPDKNTTVEDIEWLCNQIAGWDSGVDLCLDYNNIHQNPNYDKVSATFRLWEEARIKGGFTELQKINLRQTTSIYSLSKSSNGKYHLKFRKFWMDGRAKSLPSSAMKLVSVKGGSVAPCDAKWPLTHNPAIYSRICLSDNLVCQAGTPDFAEWNLTPPTPGNKKAASDISFRCVIRLAPDAKSGIKNIQLKCNGQLLGIQNVQINPGEYLAIPHNNQYAYIYDTKTNFAKRAVFILQDNPYWFLPTLKKGKVNKIEMRCDSTTPNATPKALVNIQFYDKYFSGK